MGQRVVQMFFRAFSFVGLILLLFAKRNGAQTHYTFSGKEYFIPEGKYARYNGLRECERHGNYTLSVQESREEREFVQNTILPSLQGVLFMGMTDLANEGVWITTEGKVLSRSDLNWAAGEPDGERTENCAGIRTVGNNPNQLYDVTCSTNYDVLCESLAVASFNYSGRSYLLPDKLFMWESGRQYCEGLDGFHHLVVSQTQEELSYIRDMMDVENVSSIFMGKYQVEETTHTLNGKRAHEDITRKTRCMRYSYSDDRELWTTCSNYSHIICERITQLYWTFENTTYMMPDQRLTWADAKTFCEELGGGNKLAFYRTPSEHTFMIGTIMKDVDFKYVFLGVTYSAKESAWINVDGEQMTSEELAWGPGEPNGGENQNCLVLLAFGKYFAADDACYFPRNFLCATDTPTASTSNPSTVYSLAATTQGTEIDSSSYSLINVTKGTKIDSSFFSLINETKAVQLSTRSVQPSATLAQEPKKGSTIILAIVLPLAAVIVVVAVIITALKIRQSKIKQLLPVST